MQASPATTPTESSRVSTIELFFDLVFVFTVTQVSHLVLEAQGWQDLGRAFLVLTITWWMYGGYIWLTDNVSTADTTTRLLILTAMTGFFVMALSTPEAFGENGVTFGL